MFCLLEVLAVTGDRGQAGHGLHEAVCTFFEHLEAVVGMAKILLAVLPGGEAVVDRRQGDVGLRGLEAAVKRVAQALKRASFLHVIAVVSAAAGNNLQAFPLVLLFDPSGREANLEGGEHHLM